MLQERYNQENAFDELSTNRDEVPALQAWGLGLTSIDSNALWNALTQSQTSANTEFLNGFQITDETAKRLDDGSEPTLRDKYRKYLADELTAAVTSEDRNLAMDAIAGHLESNLKSRTRSAQTEAFNQIRDHLRATGYDMVAKPGSSNEYMAIVFSNSAGKPFGGRYVKLAPSD